MRALGVVVVDVDAEYPLEVLAVEDQQPVDALGADRADEALRESRSPFGARTGVRTIVICSLRKTSSKGPVCLLSRSRIRKRICCSAKKRPRSRACWVTQLPPGL